MCSIMGYCGRGADFAAFQRGFDRTLSRGPDDTRVVDVGKGLLGFHRLAIMGLDSTGMQPFQLGSSFAVCNGELYGFEAMRAQLEEKGYTFRSGSDCEILLPLYKEYGTGMFQMLDAEFACILYDGERGEFLAARDPIGIRPLYYGYDAKGVIVFASEPKNLVGLVGEIRPFPPGHYYQGGAFHCYRDIAKVDVIAYDSLEDACGFASEPKNLVGLVGEIRPFPPGHYYQGGAFHCYRDIAKVDVIAYDSLEDACGLIREKLIAGVEKRLVADAKVGFLLSGGLDSSLVCAIAARKSRQPIRTFAIGMSQDAIDLKYARQVADYIGSHHTEVYMTPEDILASLEEVIQLLGTYDITTIRASLGMYLVCKAIHQQTDIRVLLTGEISDELFGYKYTDFAPSPLAFQEESQKRLRELHMYDVLRADRCISVNSLEARVPFGDLDFVSYVMALDPDLKVNRYGKGKYLLRHAFEDGGYLPAEILWREKAAFSDAVGHSMVDYLKAYAETQYTGEAFERGRKSYTHAQPFTKESLLYRDIFEKYYPGQSQMVVDFWMPNKEWEGCDVDDPSARVLSNYGDSGK